MRATLLAAALAAVLAGHAPRAGAEDLIEVYEQARASDPQLGVADASRRAVSENVAQSRAALLPNLSGTAQIYDNDTRASRVDGAPDENGNIVFGPVDSTSDVRNREYRVSLRQSIYNHANYTRLRASRAQRSRGEADYDAALDLLSIRVAEAYFNALTAQSNLEAAEAEERAVGRQLEQAEQRFEVGLTAITDVHEARARYDSARANVILTRNQLNDAFEALNELTGEPVETLRALDETIPLAMPEPPEPEEWVKVALEQSPALASRRFALKAAEHDVGTARAAHYPYLDAFVNYNNTAGWGDNVFGQFQAPATNSFEGTTTGLILTVPMFEGGATQSRVRQAVANRDVSSEQLEQEERAVVRNTRNAFRAVVAGMSEVEARRQAVVSAQSALEATQAGFEVGTRTIVDVLLSQQQTFAAQREYARARHQFIVAGLRLKQAAGVISVEDLQQVNALLGTERAMPEPAPVPSGDRIDTAPETDADADADADAAAKDRGDRG